MLKEYGLMCMMRKSCTDSDGTLCEFDRDKPVHAPDVTLGCRDNEGKQWRDTVESPICLPHHLADVPNYDPDGAL